MAYEMDDVLLAGTPQSSEAHGFMLRKDDPEFKKLVDDTMSEIMKGPDIKAMCAKWFMKPVPPKNINFDFPMTDAPQKLYANPNDTGLP